MPAARQLASRSSTSTGRRPTPRWPASATTSPRGSAPWPVAATTTARGGRRPRRRASPTRHRTTPRRMARPASPVVGSPLTGCWRPILPTSQVDPGSRPAALRTTGPGHADVALVDPGAARDGRPRCERRRAPRRAPGGPTRGRAARLPEGPTAALRVRSAPRHPACRGRCRPGWSGGGRTGRCC